jgi:hypothetical protein
MAARKRHDPSLCSVRGPGRGQKPGLGSDVDDDHAALFALGRRRRCGRRVSVAARTLEGHLDPALFTPSLLLFASQDLFDDPGIQHQEPPVGLSGLPATLLVL